MYHMSNFKHRTNNSIHICKNTGIFTNWIFLSSTVPAYFRSKNFNQSGIVGHSVTLACEAEGDFPIRITWSSFANSVISSKETPTSLISELRLDRLNRQHAGIYRCTASNSFGYDHMAIHLSVKGGIIS